jgi:hypothetical protein
VDCPRVIGDDGDTIESARVRVVLMKDRTSRRRGCEADAQHCTDSRTLRWASGTRVVARTDRNYHEASPCMGAVIAQEPSCWQLCTEGTIACLLKRETLARWPCEISEFPVLVAHEWAS